MSYRLLLKFFAALIFVGCVLSSCRQKNRNVNIDINPQLRIADSLIVGGKGDSALRMLAKIKPSIKATDPAITDYYCFLAEWQFNPDLKSRYADSAMAFFNVSSRKKQYPGQYYKALLCKGDVSIILKQYNTALEYYYNARKIFNVGNCDDGYVSVKMASIYYNQGNFSIAAQYWAQSYRSLLQCNQNVSYQKRFYTLQGALNNSGISFEKAGIRDSALYYYLKDVQLINDAEKKNVDIKPARIVVYDNLGGYYLKQGNYKIAEDYLTQCIAIPLTEVDGVKIPPYLKLADLYMQTGRYDDALKAFNECTIRFNRLPGQNLDLKMLWNKLYAVYKFKKGQPEEAYRCQAEYIRRKDSIQNNLSALDKLDITRELNSIGQQQAVSELAQRNQSKKIYLVGTAVIALLLLVIMVLVYRNLRRSQKLQKTTILQNQQLEQTLSELERVNQNYIRMMRVMAHDLRNPISGMTGLAAMLLGEDEFSEENKHMLHLIESTGIHTMEMINELLKSGLADENEVLQVELIDLKSLLFDSVELLQFKANEKQQQIVFKSDDTPIMGRINHEKIWRVFNNLIVNAIKFSFEKSEIKVGITHDDANVLISIADTGIGIPEKDKDSIFEMFTPAKRVGTNGEQPFGLGLSISKGIIAKHNGKIWFESTPGSGTTFYIQLPCSG